MRPGGRRKRVLLVEADAALARVLTRDLGRQYSVAAVPRISAALRLFAGGERFDVVCCARRVGDGTAGSLFDVLHRRWPRVRRIVYVDGGSVRGRVRLLADAIVDASASLAALRDALDGA